MQPFLRHNLLFWIALPFGLLGIFSPLVAYIYLALYLVATLQLIMVHEHIELDPSRSSQQHYATVGRLQYLSMVLAGYAGFASLIFATGPATRSLLLIALWVLQYLYLSKCATAVWRWFAHLLVADYLTQQTHVSAAQAIYASYALDYLPDWASEQLYAQALHTDIDQAQDLKHYFDRYMMQLQA